jgi:hypothetical protein
VAETLRRTAARGCPARASESGSRDPAGARYGDWGGLRGGNPRRPAGAGQAPDDAGGSSQHPEGARPADERRRPAHRVHPANGGLAEQPARRPDLADSSRWLRLEADDLVRIRSGGGESLVARRNHAGISGPRVRAWPQHFSAGLGRRRASPAFPSRHERLRIAARHDRVVAGWRRDLFHRGRASYRRREATRPASRRHLLVRRLSAGALVEDRRERWERTTRHRRRLFDRRVHGGPQRHADRQSRSFPAQPGWVSERSLADAGRRQRRRPTDP